MHLNHIDLPVGDLAAARSFMERHFGFRCILAGGNHLVVLEDEAGFALTLSAVPAGEAASYPTGFHIGFNQASEEDLLSAHARLAAAGVDIVRPLARMGAALTFQCRAPGPLIVELGWWPPHEAASGLRFP